MKAYQREFIELARRCDVLRFGSFTLKSGRQSPYFFNAGAFDSGAALAALGSCYAQRIVDSDIQFDVLLGPAYKGIPLACATAVALARDHGLDIPFAYNRKEAKSHGEGGTLVGAPLQGRVLVIDDVITAGTAVGEVIDMIRAAGAELAGVIIGLNRQERGQGPQSAIQEIESKWQVPVLSIVSMLDLIDYLESSSVDSGSVDSGSLERGSPNGDPVKSEPDSPLSAGSTGVSEAKTTNARSSNARSSKARSSKARSTGDIPEGCLVAMRAYREQYGV